MNSRGASNDMLKKLKNLQLQNQKGDAEAQHHSNKRSLGLERLQLLKRVILCLKIHLLIKL